MPRKLEEIIDNIINGTRLRHCRNQDCKLASHDLPLCLLREIYLDKEGKCEKFIKKD